MKTIAVAIVDDEISNVEILANILETQCEGVEVIWTATNLQDAQKNIQEKKIDILFMDIEMPPHCSFELLETISKPDFEVVFVTAYQDYALRALKMAALDYIIKPIKATDINRVINKLREKNNFGELTGLIKNYLNGPERFSKIVVHVNDGYDIVDISNIIHIEALDSYSKIKLVGNVSYVTSRSLKDFEELLSDKGFYRIHKSYLINLRHMMKIIKGAAASVIMANGTCIPVSARKRDTFFTELKGIISF
ncbi:MAG TPA: LytTR family DNA-binding domain-containing protein [Bacteroidia bacterium]|nr:LytTR family DNA-binding domain-containing protein [Bacteroidia bacterium]